MPLIWAQLHDQPNKQTGVNTDHQQYQSPAPQVSQGGKPPVIIASGVVRDGWLHRFVDWTEKHHDFVIAVGTMALAAFTLALFVATAGLLIFARVQAHDMRKLARATRRSARIAERALLELDRPHIFVTELFSRIMRSSYVPHTPYVEFKISNFGRAPAIIKRRQIGLVFVTEIPSTPPWAEAIDKLDWTALAPERDLKETQVSRADRPYSPDDLAPMITGDMKCLFFGRIEYEDVAHNSYFTEFGWLYRFNLAGVPASNEGFEVCDQPGYNENK